MWKNGQNEAEHSTWMLLAANWKDRSPMDTTRTVPLISTQYNDTTCKMITHGNTNTCHRHNCGRGKACLRGTWAVRENMRRVAIQWKTSRGMSDSYASHLSLGAGFQLTPATHVVDTNVCTHRWQCVIHWFSRALYSSIPHSRVQLRVIFESDNRHL